MDLDQIKVSLQSEDPQDRMRGLTALRHFDAEVAAPILMTQVDDTEMIVRSFVVMGLGYKQTEAGFTKLLQVMEEDVEANVRAEAAGALGKYGSISIPHLVKYFEQDQHWLAQISTILALADLQCPEILLDICQRALQTPESAIRTTAIDQLPTFVGTAYQEKALLLLLSQAQDPDWSIRRNVAKSLRAFADDRARAQLIAFQRDADHRVVAASLENLI
ncbi:HEAT repeat domain-containing protein [Alkalinema sp. FACHB-956]|uniref:HEAT repeat domain-containing protein n=1 Tax=Alkalinema sp. FACHB-956 TaxID=2692768 RepID=UPI001685BC93|nr:HEAT repeat domain-containing protein [Alkalinema sp. FACHB-956]MBD2328033.1 HEAT repeat domain-containing protein [Alkalinema sp. FACHB-956]